MKLSRTIFALVCIAGLTQLIWSQDKTLGLPGYLDPRTHTLSARAQAEVPDTTTTTTATYYYGTVQVTLIISVASSFPSGTQYTCGGSASVYDSGGGSFTETAAANAPAPSSGKTTCTFSMPYYWQLSNPTTDEICISFSADAFNVFTVGSTTEIAKLREADREVSPCITGVPTTNGTLTSVTYYTRL